METRVLIQSAPKPYAAFPPPQLHTKFDQEWPIFKFKSVDNDDRWTMDHWYTISIQLSPDTRNIYVIIIKF